MSARPCRDVRADLSAYLDGDLDAGPAGETRLHLESCAACRSELELLRLTVGALRRLPDLPPPAAILTGVRARVQPEPWYRRLFGGGLSRVNFPLSAAATLLAVLGISLFVARYPDMPKTVPQDASPHSPTPPAPQIQAEPAPIARPQPPAAALKDAHQEESPREKSLPAELAVASTGIGVVCLLLPDGDTVSDLERLLRREGAVDIELNALEPPALREVFTRHRGRPGNQPEPSQGWTLTARVQAPALARLLEALAGRTGLRILEQPAAPDARGEPAGPLDLRITVLR